MHKAKKNFLLNLAIFESIAESSGLKDLTWKTGLERF